MKDTIIFPDVETSVGDCVTVCAGVIVVLVGVRVSDCKDIGVVDVGFVADDGALHPDTKSRKITKKAKIGRTFINVYSISYNL